MAEKVIEAAVGSVEVVALLMRADAIGLRHHGGGGEEAEVLAPGVQVEDGGIVGTGLVAPLGVGDDGVVVVDELSADAEAVPALFRIANLGVGKLEIPADSIRRPDGGVLIALTGVLDLRCEPQPACRMQICLEAEAVQQVGVIDAGFEVVVVVRFITEALLALEIDPFGQLAIEVSEGGNVVKVVGRGVAGGTEGRSIEEA